jgi:hypothetical protein
LREPNLGKTNPRVSLTYSLAICFAPSLADSFIFLTLTWLVVVFIFVNFSFALFTPPLGDFQFSSGSPAAFPHQWAIWWREASRAAASAPPSASRIFVIRAEAEERTEWGVPPAWVGNPFLPPAFGGKGILQPRGGFLQPCRGRRTAAAQPGCSIPSSVRAMVASRTGRPCPGLPRADSRARGLPSTSCAARAVLMFWGGLGEGGSKDRPVRFGAAGARCCGVEVAAAREGFSADEIANSACTSGPPSPWLEWLVLVLCGREPFCHSVCPEAVAAAVLPPGMEVVAAAVRAGGGEPLGVRRPAGLPVWRLFIPAGMEPESRL